MLNIFGCEHVEYVGRCRRTMMLTAYTQHNATLSEHIGFSYTRYEIYLSVNVCNSFNEIIIFQLGFSSKREMC